uniref:Uncharacterized protein n=1 Tax=Zea mays TaxID=4577 RepID=A0A804RFV6_MAIZE
MRPIHPIKGLDGETTKAWLTGNLIWVEKTENPAVILPDGQQAIPSNGLISTTTVHVRNAQGQAAEDLRIWLGGGGFRRGLMFWLMRKGTAMGSFSRIWGQELPPRLRSSAAVRRRVSDGCALRQAYAAGSLVRFLSGHRTSGACRNISVAWPEVPPERDARILYVRSAFHQPGQIWYLICMHQQLVVFLPFFLKSPRI